MARCVGSQSLTKKKKRKLNENLQSKVKRKFEPTADDFDYDGAEDEGGISKRARNSNLDSSVNWKL